MKKTYIQPEIGIQIALCDPTMIVKSNTEVPGGYTKEREEDAAAEKENEEKNSWTEGLW